MKKIKLIILNQIFILFLIGLIIFSTSGFIIHKHSCSENNETGLIVFLEITDINKSCLCCENDKKLSVITNTEDVIKKTECCSNIKFFIKIFETINVLSCFKELSVIYVKYINTHWFETYLNQLIFYKTVSFLSPPVIFTGRSYIHFIHNVKIPFPEV